MYKKRKYFIILSLLLIVTLSLVGCGGSDPVSDATDELVYKDYSTDDFSFKYPSSWTAITSSDFISSIRSGIETDYYGSGVHLEGTSYGQQYAIIAFDCSSEATNEITADDVYEIAAEFDQLILDMEASASIQETSSLDFDGNPAKKTIFRYYNSDIKKDSKLETILIGKEYKLFFIVSEATIDGYSNSIGIFTEIKDSTKLY
jgi:hypothetical protein